MSIIQGAFTLTVSERFTNEVKEIDCILPLDTTLLDFKRIAYRNNSSFISVTCEPIVMEYSED